MKVLSIKEPFPSLMIYNIKNIETRSWKTNYRGELYIHTSKEKIKHKDERIQALIKLLPIKDLSYGNIIGKCDLIDCIYMNKEFVKEIKKNKIEYFCGRYEVRRYAWIVDNIEILDNKIAAKGQLGIWNYK